MSNLHRWVLAAVAACACPPLLAAAPDDGMRMPWQRGNTEYTRHWLIAAPIACDLPTDCVVGGEANLRATPGAKQPLTKGDPAEWRRADSWGNGLAFGDLPDGQTAYAFTNVPREKAGKARISIGTDDGVRVWLNGKRILARDGRRDVNPDEDALDVDFVAGDNALLVKTGARSTVVLRVMEAGATHPRLFEIAPSVIEMHPDLFSVRTDATKARADAAPVDVEVFAPGGERRFAKSAARGELVVVAARDWPDGPYEIHASTTTPEWHRFSKWLTWYKGDSLAKARELAAVAAKADAATPEGATLRMLAEMVDDRLGAKVADARGNPWTKIHSPLMEFDELLLERAGRTGRVRPGGFVRLAWIDDTDGTPQWCRAYLPASYDAGAKFPTILQLHGTNPENPPYIRWWNVDLRHASVEDSFSRNPPFIYIEPHGRGNAQYNGFGNADVRRCLAEAKRLLAVDHDRVYLTGDSMGGWGTWNVATRNPELFAAIAPVFGGLDYHSTMKPEQLATLMPVERFLQERDSSWAQAESLNNVPIFVHHGDADAAVNVEWSRWGVKLLQRWGYDVRYREYPGKVHEALSWSNPLMNAEFFLANVRDPNPRHVRVRSAELRNAQAYWVRVEQRARPLEFMRVDAEVVDRNVIRLDTDNVVDIVLTPSALIDPGKPVTVVWNGVPREMAPASGGGLRLTDAAYRPAALRKSRQLPGSINDIFNTPFAVVVGTSSKDARTREICRLHGEQFATAWQQWQKHRPRYFLDTEITDADIAKYSLILVGGADANRVSAKLADGIPLRIRGDTVTIGGRSFHAPGAGVQMIWPHPRNPERYVLISAGTAGNALGYAAPSPYGLVEWDFVIEDGIVPPVKEWSTRERLRVASGMFDQNWRVDPAFVVTGDAAARAGGRRLAMPAGRKADDKLLAEIAGHYQIEGGPLVEVFLKDGRAFVKAGSEDGEFEYVDGLGFYIPRFPVWITFTRDPSGAIDGFTGWGNGDLVAKRKE
jgi:dienelactone hydrolase